MYVKKLTNVFLAASKVTSKVVISDPEINNLLLLQRLSLNLCYSCIWLTKTDCGFIFRKNPIFCNVNMKIEPNTIFTFVTYEAIQIDRLNDKTGTITV